MLNKYASDIMTDLQRACPEASYSIPLFFSLWKLYTFSFQGKRKKPIYLNMQMLLLFVQGTIKQARDYIHPGREKASISTET